MTNIVPPLQRVWIADPVTGDPIDPADFGSGSATDVSALATSAKQDTLAGLVATAANQATLNTEVGATNETAPANDTAAAGLNGRMQRVAQRLTTMITGGLKLAASEENVGIVGGHTPRCTATFTTAADAGAYAAGDLIANSTTAASVVPLTFDVSRSGAAINSGRVFSVRGVVTPASSNLVITALDFDLLLFRPESGIPFAAGSYPASNAALSVSAAMYRELIGIFRFYATGWRSPAGSVVTAGVTGYQRGTLSVPFSPYNLASMSGTTLLGLVQAQSAWAPGAIAQQFDFALDLDQD